MTSGILIALELDDEGEPIAQLRAVREAQGRLERAAAEQVRRARNKGYSWHAIGGALQISKQAAHKKYGRS